MAFVPAQVQAQNGAITISFCDASQQKGGRCVTTATRFQITEHGLARIYVNWVVSKGQVVKQWTRRWSYFPGDPGPTVCLFSTNTALKPKPIANGQLYQSVFSTAEGNGPKVFYEPQFIWGDYTLELFADGKRVGKATFEVRASVGGDVPIKASLC